MHAEKKKFDRKCLDLSSFFFNHFVQFPLFACLVTGKIEYQLSKVSFIHRPDPPMGVSISIPDILYTEEKSETINYFPKLSSLSPIGN
jgi:hypothetical protein